MESKNLTQAQVDWHAQHCGYPKATSKYAIKCRTLGARAGRNFNELIKDTIHRSAYRIFITIITSKICFFLYSRRQESASPRLVGHHVALLWRGVTLRVGRDDESGRQSLARREPLALGVIQATSNCCKGVVGSCTMGVSVEDSSNIWILVNKNAEKMEFCGGRRLETTRIAMFSAYKQE